MVEVFDFAQFLFVEDLLGHQVEAMIDNGCPHEVVPSLMGAVNSGEQEHHIFVELSSVIPVSNLVNSLHNDLINDFSGVSVDQSNPSVDYISLLLECSINGFQHLNATDDIMKSSLAELFATHLEHQNQCFDIPLEFSRQIKSLDNQVSSLFKKLSLNALISV